MYNYLTDDWNAVAPSVLQQVSSSLQAPVQQQTIRVYLSAPDGMQQEVDLLKQVNVHPWGTLTLWNSHGQIKGLGKRNEAALFPVLFCF